MTLVPSLSVPRQASMSPSSDAHADDSNLVVYRPVVDEETGLPPSRRVVIVWRRSFPRYEAIVALRSAILACELRGATLLDSGYMWLVPVPAAVLMALLLPGKLSLSWAVFTIQFLMMSKIILALRTLRKGKWVRNITV